MKINWVMLLISLAIAVLAAYGFYAWNNGESVQWLITIGSGLMLLVTLGGCLAVSSETRGLAGNIRIISLIFFIISIVSNCIFSVISEMNIPPYIIINGIILLLFVLISYAINRALK
jgi:hypothetical protein